MSRRAPSSLRTALVVDTARDLTSAVSAAVSYTGSQAINLLNRFVAMRARVFAQQLRDVDTTE